MKEIKKQLSNKNILVVLIVIIIVVASVVSLYFYNQYRRTQSLLQNPSQQAEVEAQALISQVGKLIELPTGEKPTIATVSDVNKLADQAFFANAKNGDRVLIYSLAKKAILFRQSENKIIEVAPVNLGGSQPQPSTTSLNTNITPVVTPIPTASIGKVYKISIFNGTLSSGLAASTQKSIEQHSKDFQVVSKKDASKSDYSQTLVVDIAGDNKSAAQELAGLINGKVGNLPDGENAPSGIDFLVILGSSSK